MTIYHISFDTMDMPGSIKAVRVELAEDIFTDERARAVSFNVALAEHPLYSALVRYVLLNAALPPVAIPLSDMPAQGEIYRHYKGGEYEVLHLSQREINGDWEVVYRERTGNRVFNRPLREWPEKVWHNGNHVLRFTRVTEENWR